DSEPPAVEWYLASALLRNGKPNEAASVLQKITDDIASTSAVKIVAGGTEFSVTASVSARSRRTDYGASPSVRLNLLASFLEKGHDVDIVLNAHRKLLEVAPTNLEPY